MNKQILIVLVAGVLGLSACGSDKQEIPPRQLFSAWASSNLAKVIDMTGGSFAAGQPFTYELYTTQKCSCTATYSGNNSSATAVLAGCVYVSGGSGDPGCAGINGTWTITNTGHFANFCVGSNCETYL